MSDGDVLLLTDRVRLAIKIGESQYREFKSALHGPPGNKKPRTVADVAENIGNSLVAFANADGGELIVGVEDDGTVTGIPFSGTQLESIMEAPERNVHRDTPLPSPRAVTIDIDGKTVAYFSVPKGTTYVYLTSFGRCLRREDSATVPVPSEKILAQRLEDASRKWDREMEGAATLEDLDLGLIRATSAQISYGVSIEKFLQFFDLADFTSDGLKLRRAALLLFAKDVRRWHTGCFVRILVIRGQERLSGPAFNVVKDTVISENLMRIVDATWERLTLALSTQVQLTQQIRFEQNFLYPQSACIEAITNAVVHRNYAIEGRGIEISIFQDRMEIASPGRLLSTISLEDLTALKGAHESRNPFVARVLREVGLVRELGEGIRRIFDLMKSSALAEPEFRDEANQFIVSLRNTSLYEPKVKLWLSMFERFNLDEDQIAVLSLGFDGARFSTQDIINRLGLVDVDKVRAIITPLRSRGILKRSNLAPKRGVPKRELPIYSVVATVDLDKISLGRTPSADSSDDETASKKHVYKIFIANLDTSVTREEVIALLSTKCEVLSFRLPPPLHAAAINRGFAFAEVSSSLDRSALFAAFGGVMLKGKPISVRQDRQLGWGPKRRRTGSVAAIPARQLAGDDGAHK